MIISIHDVWADAAEKHQDFLRARVASVLQRQKAFVGPVLNLEAQVIHEISEFLDRNLNMIIDVTMRDFSAVITDFNRTFPSDGISLDPAKQKFKEIFDYDAFSKDRVGWGAYALCRAARHKVCPYCHIRTTETVLPDDDHAGYRPQLDHFYNKARYPYLALSLGNLVPCCGTCNGPGMKHNKDFVSIPHLNPLRDAEVFKFKLIPANGGTWDPSLRALREPKTLYKVGICGPTDNQMAANALKTFQLLSQYQLQLADAHHVARIGVSGAFVRSVAIATGIDVHGMTVVDHLRFDPNGDEYKGRPAGKMLRDIYLDCQNW